MKTLFYGFLGFTGFALCILLGHVAVAYPAIRAGVLFIILTLIVFIGIGAGASAIAMKAGKGGYMTKGDMQLAILPAAIVLALVLTGLCLGVVVGA